jgi:predicted nucleic acid-binding protein
MNVYVESNFVLELALDQEQSESCKDIVKLASDGSIRLVVPAFSLAEPHITLMRKRSERSRLRNELKKPLSELGRSKTYGDVPSRFSELDALLIASAERERTGLQGAMDEMLKAAEIIPLGSDIFHQASGIRAVYDMSVQDSIVLASIISHLVATKAAESCLLNRDNDFDDPNIRENLSDLGCRFISRFDHGLRYVEAWLRSKRG